MVLDQTGSLANIKRHDYLPFGEELIAPIGGRSTAQGYAGGDAVRQQFTAHERDVETGLDFMQARYYSSVMGRLTSADTYAGRPENPQSLNLYGYVVNNPLRYIDPTGHFPQDKPVRPNEPCSKEKRCDPDENDRIVVEVNQEKDKPIRSPFDWRHLPSPFRGPTFLCPTGNCFGRTLGDDANLATRIVATGQQIGRRIAETAHSIEANVRVGYVIDFGARLTADGDVFLSFTPPQKGLQETVTDAISKIEITRLPVSWSITSTHMFGESNIDTRRSFFSGNSFSAGGAVPIYRGVGPYVGGVYSPSAGRFGLQTGIASGGISGGLSVSPQNPTFQFPRLSWKKPR